MPSSKTEQNTTSCPLPPREGNLPLDGRSSLTEELQALLKAHPEYRPVIESVVTKLAFTDEERRILETRHANTYEAATLRDRLWSEHALIYCSSCKTVKAPNQFSRSKRGRGGRVTRCHSCSNGRRKSGFKAIGIQYDDNQRRFIENNPERAKEIARECYHRTKQLKGPRPKLVTEAVSKRRNYDKRLSLGMTGREANYMSPIDPAMQERWDSIKENAGS